MRKDAGRGGYGDKFIELRVEDNSDPVAELKRLLKIHRVYYLIDEAESKFTQSNSENAISSINEALKIKPDNDDAYIDLGLIYLKLGKAGEAVKAFKKALSINPKMAAVIKQLPKLGVDEIPEGFLKQLQL